jgi:hypothetical protein
MRRQGRYEGQDANDKRIKRKYQGQSTPNELNHPSGDRPLQSSVFAHHPDSEGSVLYAIDDVTRLRWQTSPMAILMRMMKPDPLLVGCR